MTAKKLRFTLDIQRLSDESYIRPNISAENLAEIKDHAIFMVETSSGPSCYSRAMAIVPEFGALAAVAIGACSGGEEGWYKEDDLPQIITGLAAMSCPENLESMFDNKDVADCIVGLDHLMEDLETVIEEVDSYMSSGVTFREVNPDDS